MKTTQTLAIQLSEITSDSITFSATIGLSHALTTGYGIDNHDDIVSLYGNESTLDWHFVVTQNKIHTILNHENIDILDFDDFAFAYGNAIASFVKHAATN